MSGVKKYRCAKPIYWQETNNDGTIAEDGMAIEVQVGSVYRMGDLGFLVNEDGWLLLEEKALEEHFERVGE